MTLASRKLDPLRKLRLERAIHQLFEVRLDINRLWISQLTQAKERQEERKETA